MFGFGDDKSNALRDFVDKVKGDGAPKLPVRAEDTDSGRMYKMRVEVLGGLQKQGVDPNALVAAIRNNADSISVEEGADGRYLKFHTGRQRMGALENAMRASAGMDLVLFDPAAGGNPKNIQPAE